MLKHVERVIAETKDEAIKLLFTHIAEDERKHHKNILCLSSEDLTCWLHKRKSCSVAVEYARQCSFMCRSSHEA